MTSWSRCKCLQILATWIASCRPDVDAMLSESSRLIDCRFVAMKPEKDLSFTRQNTQWNSLLFVMNYHDWKNVQSHLQLTFCGLAKVAILPQMFIRSTHFKFTKNCHTKHWTATFAKPLLPAGVLSVEWRKSLSVMVFAVIVELWMGLFVSAVGSGFKKFRREGILKNNFSFGGRGVSSFAIFGLCVGLCELQMCLHLCVRICSCSQVL